MVTIYWAPAWFWLQWLSVEASLSLTASSSASWTFQWRRIKIGGGKYGPPYLTFTTGCRKTRDCTAAPMDQGMEPDGIPGKGNLRQKDRRESKNITQRSLGFRWRVHLVCINRGRKRWITWLRGRGISATRAWAFRKRRLRQRRAWRAQQGGLCLVRSMGLLTGSAWCVEALERKTGQSYAAKWEQVKLGAWGWRENSFPLEDQMGSPTWGILMSRWPPLMFHMKSCWWFFSQEKINPQFIFFQILFFNLFINFYYFHLLYFSLVSERVSWFITYIQHPLVLPSNEKLIICYLLEHERAHLQHRNYLFFLNILVESNYYI